jgi:hypothetical protein
MTLDSMRMSRVVALALIVGTFLTAQAVLVDLAAGKTISVVRNVTVALLFWVVWAFLTPVVNRSVAVGISARLDTLLRMDPTARRCRSVWRFQFQPRPLGAIP